MASKKSRPAPARDDAHSADTGAVPAGGVAVSVSLKLERGRWTPALERSLPTFIESIAATTSRAILGARAALEPA